MRLHHLLEVLRRHNAGTEEGLVLGEVVRHSQSLVTMFVALNVTPSVAEAW
jgi:uncharacterized protein YejL (UPF0352 family)